MIGGVALAALGRQTAVPLALAAAIGLVLVWGKRPGLRLAALAIAAAVAVFCAEWLVARPFSTAGSGDVSTFTFVRSLGHPVRLLHSGIVNADARAFLGVLVALGLIAGAWARGRRPELVPSLLAVAVFVQPFLLAPSYVGHNSTRIAALALPALALVAAYQLRELALSNAPVWISIGAILAASFYPRYSDVGVSRSSFWAVLDVVAAVAVALAVAGSGSEARRDQISVSS